MAEGYEPRPLPDIITTQTTQTTNDSGTIFFYNTAYVVIGASTTNAAYSILPYWSATYGTGVKILSATDLTPITYTEVTVKAILMKIS